MSPRRRRPSRRPTHPPRESIYPTLDLHGETGDSARLRADRWLRAQQAAGERVVRIVTGRGLHSVGPPVLPTEIGHLLDTLKGTLVAGHETEPGGGSIRVALRSAAAPVASPQPKLRAGPVDPRLWREAEESLAELGVHPTPALVEAEVERIRRVRGS